MRIVNAMFGKGLGGIEQALVDYCEALAFCGHEAVALIHPKAAVRDVLDRKAISYHTLPNWGSWDAFAAWRLKRLLRRIAPDACIGHGNRALRLLQKAGAPRVIAVMHNYGIAFSAASFVFYPTQDLLRSLEQKKSSRPAFPIPNMVRVADKAPQARRAPPVIGAMGRLVSKKGFAVFIKALALLKARGLAFRAVLAGSGEEMANLRQLAQEKGLGEQLHFTGWTDDKQAFFDAIDIFCLPSLHEPFGIVLLEAMAQALPVVAADAEGPSEIITHGIDGLLMAKDDPGLLADTLAQLLSDPHYGALLARNAHDTAKNRYSLGIVARKLDLALRTICRL